ncbi:MAG TPA: DUF1330 domain-containing protein [Usitatibacteraceae bacterium]
MAAYLTGHIKIRDAEKWHDYLDQVDATIIAYGGEILLRGLQQEILSNPGELKAEFERLVVLRFDNMESLHRWYHSSEYQQLRPLRAAGADVTVVTYETDSHRLHSA